MKRKEAINAPEVVEQLVSGHIGLARLCSSKFESVDPEEVYSWAMRGLLKAAELYDATKGAAFSTYARIKINGSIQDGFTFLDAKKRGNYVEHRELDEVIFPDRLGGGRTLHEFVPSSEPETYEDLTRALLGLNPRQQRIIDLRFGLTDGRPRNLKEAGRAIGLSESRMCRVEAEAIAQLRAQMKI